MEPRPGDDTEPQGRAGRRAAAASAARTRRAVASRRRLARTAVVVAVAACVGTAGYSAQASSEPAEGATGASGSTLSGPLGTADAASHRPDWANGWGGSLQRRADHARQCWQSQGGSQAPSEAASSETEETVAQPAPSQDGSSAPTSDPAPEPVEDGAGQPDPSDATGQPPASGAGSGSSDGGSSASGTVPAGWRQVFSEDFDRDARLGTFASVYGDRFAGYEGSRDTSKRGLYSEARTVSVSGGLLDIALHSEGGQPLGAALVPATNGAPYTGQEYGRYEMRFRADSTPGYGMAALLWPDSDDWGEGEIDFPEGDLDGTLWWANKLGTSSEFDKANSNVETAAGWHTSVVEWTPAGVRFFIDGTQVGSSSHSPTTPFHWVVQTGTTGTSTPSSSAGHVQIDWMRAYAFEG